MRKLQPILLLTGLSIACLFLSNCKDLKKNYSVKGRLLHSCDNPVPVKDFKVDLYNTHHRCEGVIQSAYTNADGNFLLDYDATCSDNFNELILQYDVSFSSAKLVQKIKINQNEDLGDIYLKDNGWYEIKIKTNHLYTLADTLFYNITGGGSGDNFDYLFVTGPFKDGQKVNTLYKTVYKIQHGDRVKPMNHFSRWILKSGTVIHSDKYLWDGEDYYLEPCKKYNEVILDISK